MKASLSAFQQNRRRPCEGSVASPTSALGRAQSLWLAALRAGLQRRSSGRRALDAEGESFCFDVVRYEGLQFSSEFFDARHG